MFDIEMNAALLLQSPELEHQIDEIERIAATGIDAFVLVTNRLAKPEEPDEVWIRLAEKLLERLPGIRFGLYECPYPYKRLLSPKLLRWCSSRQRFYFLKDTSCSLNDLRAKMEAVRGSRLKIFNANSATLLESLKMGVAGFSGIMANFHPELYVWFANNWRREPQKAEWLQAFLSTAALIESQPYPLNAKYHLQQEGIPISLFSRSRDYHELKAVHRLEAGNLKRLCSLLKEQWSINSP
ncbi:dihydrodipicolinate synthase family protein [Paenibacillus filicis]|uniref:Dihydrodipicolinate synthase family protein n=1 Tax=Paenibacillus gyeongsangnamensis TaxID=3388067 RepID=A0ABT4QLU8_9BACL|nr:dihydrodipicolinate synthase family protein [Paenibacillus filicis]MCZ8517839.1 dihydrodipicolinate synthase family protein [Paenibacillus filicis]